MVRSTPLVDTATVLDDERSTETVSTPKSIVAESFVEIGRVLEVTRERTLVVVSSLGSQSLAAQRLATVTDLEPHDEVLVAVVGEPRRVVILGRLFDSRAPSRDVRVNGKRISIEADSEVILKCASATIRIDRNGLVSVRGDRVTSQARGSNRIRGGSVDIN